MGNQEFSGTSVSLTDENRIYLNLLKIDVRKNSSEKT